MTRQTLTVGLDRWSSPKAARGAPKAQGLIRRGGLLQQGGVVTVEGSSIPLRVSHSAEAKKRGLYDEGGLLETGG
jgi:hypothetical protein